MPIQVGDKGITLRGQRVAPYTYVDYLTRAEEQAAIAGGDAVDVPPRSQSPQEWILTGATGGQSSAWLPFMPGMTLGLGLDSGSANTIWSVDIGFDAVTSAGQGWNDSWDRPAGNWLKSPPLQLSPALASLFLSALNAGTARGIFFRFNVLSGGPMSVARNI